MAETKYVVNNMWNYGEIGERLSGIRTSDIYSSGAKEITNFLVTDIGSLKVAKTYDKITLDLQGSILDVRETAKGYSLILTSEYIYRLNNTTNEIEQGLAHSLGDNTKIEVIGKNEFVLYNGTDDIISYSMDDDIELSDTFDDIDCPIRYKEDVKLDLWVVSSNPYYVSGSSLSSEKNKLRVVQQSTLSDPKIKVSGGKIYLPNSSIQINRIYTTYSSSVDIDYFDNPQKGDIYGILYTFEEIEDDKTYIVNNTSVEIGDLTFDEEYNGNYFTSMTGEDSGLLSFGQLIDNISSPERVAFYQDRTYFYKDGLFYASKMSEPSNFRNDSNSDDAFYFQLDPIDNKIGEITGVISNIGLFILTTAGVYIIGYGGTQITPTSIGSNISVISNVSCSDKFCVKNNSVYFLNSKGTLQVLLLDKTSVQTSFNTVDVDRFSFKNLFKDLCRVSIDNTDYVVCRSKDEEYIYIIDIADSDGIFRKVKLELDTSGATKFLSLEDKILSDKDLFIPTEKNYKYATITLNPFNLTQGGILYTYDNSSIINDIVVKLYNEDREGIEGVLIDGKPITNLPSSVEDVYSIYKQRTSIRVKTGFSIQISTNENDKIVELQGIQSLVNLVIDN